jgi:hypothetical protein
VCGSDQIQCSAGTARARCVFVSRSAAYGVPPLLTLDPTGPSFPTISPDRVRSENQASARLDPRLDQRDFFAFPAIGSPAPAPAVPVSSLQRRNCSERLCGTTASMRAVRSSLVACVAGRARVDHNCVPARVARKRKPSGALTVQGSAPLLRCKRPLRRRLRSCGRGHRHAAGRDPSSWTGHLRLRNPNPQLRAFEGDHPGSQRSARPPWPLGPDRRVGQARGAAVRTRPAAARQTAVKLASPRY